MTGITLTLSSPTVELKDGKGSLTASVTNSSAEAERVVLGAFPGQPGGQTYTTVANPLRTIGPGATDQYLVAFDTTGAAPGSYPVKLIAYSADDAPEDYADQAHVVTLTVSQAPAPGKPPSTFPWLWVIIGGVVLLLAIGAVLWFLVRGGGNVPDVRGKQQGEAAQILIGAGFSMGSTEVVSTEPPGTVISQNPAAGGTAEKGSTVSVEIARAADKCQPGYVYRRVTPDDKVCVTPASAAQVLEDNAASTQSARKPNPPGGPYGINTCLQGFVWRDAYDGDQVCVTGETRTRTKQENDEAALHSAP
ncbi:PASTA domain-containing protein [Arthrobacter silvisoli]|uniref:PASTA domain-containing protein n=1 Tax=Arthrobacter silvisoli TaxID=2291022 RepID=UPI000E20DF6A|nr:PASTA domain-containing protein [Arthrobacter silvisoli]